MSEILYVRGDATVPSGEGAKVVAHVYNDIGGWGRGFVKAVSERWPEPEAAYRAWYRAREENDFALGAVQVVRVETDVWVANLIGQRGGSRAVPVRYEAIDTALAALAPRALDLGAGVHMPRIGCGLAGGTWSRVEPLISERLLKRGVHVTVYDPGEGPQ
ncbi:Appr-1-p processing protein [Streptomyces sp. HUAS TT11]|uniref:Appr-1-p processing protein n=1 Tax=Streptomyces sp. HUAS TT11 TaxID=3447508 RepID=UPI003F65CC97